MGIQWLKTFEGNSLWLQQGNIWSATKLSSLQFQHVFVLFGFSNNLKLGFPYLRISEWVDQETGTCLQIKFRVGVAVGAVVMWYTKDSLQIYTQIVLSFEN